MGIRLEHIISIVIGLIVVSFFLIEIEPESPVKSENTKELAFTDTRLIEVDTHKILGLAHSRYGEYEKKNIKTS